MSVYAPAEDEDVSLSYIRIVWGLGLGLCRVRVMLGRYHTYGSGPPYAVRIIIRTDQDRRADHHTYGSGPPYGSSYVRIRTAVSSSPSEPSFTTIITIAHRLVVIGIHGPTRRPICDDHWSVPSLHAPERCAAMSRVQRKAEVRRGCARVSADSEWEVIHLIHLLGLAITVIVPR